MARPSRVPIQSGQVSWDADVSDNFKALFDGPFPMFEDTEALDFTAIEARYPAADYDRCMYSQNVNDGAFVGYYVLWSDGVDWHTLAKHVADHADLTTSQGSPPATNGDLPSIPDPADTPADADTLRDDLVTNVLPAVRESVEELRDHVNGLLAKLRSAGVIGP